MKKQYRNVALLVGVTGLAYTAGQFDLLTGVEPAAEAAVVQDAQEVVVDEQMMAYMQAGMPGEHHRLLDRLVGEWEGEFSMVMEPGAEPMKSEGTVKREWILDGRYLQEFVVVESDMGRFEGIGYMGYDNIDGVYKMIWMDSMSTSIHFESAILDTNTMIMTSRGQKRDPVTGRIAVTSGEFDMSDRDKSVYSGYESTEDGSMFQSFTGVMRRVDR